MEGCPARSSTSGQTWRDETRHRALPPQHTARPVSRRRRGIPVSMSLSINENAAKEFRPTTLVPMEHISDALDGGPPLLQRHTSHRSRQGVNLRSALRVLIEEGFVVVTPGPRNSHLHERILPLTNDGPRQFAGHGVIQGLAWTSRRSRSRCRWLKRPPAERISAPWPPTRRERFPYSNNPTHRRSPDRSIRLSPAPRRGPDGPRPGLGCGVFRRPAAGLRESPWHPLSRRERRRPPRRRPCFWERRARHRTCGAATAPLERQEPKRARSSRVRTA